MHLLLILIHDRQIDGIVILYLVRTLRECLVVIIDDGLGVAAGYHAHHPDKSYCPDNGKEDIESVSWERDEVSGRRYGSNEGYDLHVHLAGLA